MESYDDAVERVKEEVSDDKLRKHMYAVSDIMEALAEELGEEVSVWGRVGLLHDIDYEETRDDHERHGLVSAEMLEDELSDEELDAIRAHNHEHTEVEPENVLDHALIAADAISGLIVATALVMPDSKLEQVRKESVMKKIDSSSFASSIDRDRIRRCEEIGMDLEKFVEVSLKAMKIDSERLGL